MKQIAMLLVAATIATSLPGCSALSGMMEKLEASAAQNRLQAYRAVQDKVMLNAFYELSSDGRRYGTASTLQANGFNQEFLKPDAYVLRKTIAYSVSPGEVMQQMASYDYDGASDTPAQIYVSTAKKRGNSIRLYKPAMAAHINRTLGVPFQHFPATAKTLASVEWYDLDNPLVEYDRNGRIVSVMVRAHQMFAGVGADVIMYTSIHFGPNVGRRLENGLRNSLFAEYYIRNI